MVLSFMGQKEPLEKLTSLYTAKNAFLASIFYLVSSQNI